MPICVTFSFILYQRLLPDEGPWVRWGFCNELDTVDTYEHGTTLLS